MERIAHLSEKALTKPNVTLGKGVQVTYNITKPCMTYFDRNGNDNNKNNVIIIWHNERIHNRCGSSTLKNEKKIKKKPFYNIKNSC